MKKKGFVFILVFILFASGSQFIGSACTTFCVNSSQVFYGKNWDFDTSRKGDVVISLNEVAPDLASLNFRLSSSGFLCSAINSAGFYVTCNEDSGVGGEFDDSYAKNAVDIAALREKSVEFTDISDVKDYIGNKNVTCFGYNEHVFFADRNGNSCLVETDNKKTYITDGKDGFLVTTNFPLYTLSAPDDLEQVYCYRYKNAYTEIKNNFETFDLDEAIETLKCSVQPDYTIYSFIYSAKENAVYLFLNQDFEKIWKISFAEKNIIAWRGFEKVVQIALDERGVLFTDLETFQNTGTLPGKNQTNRPSTEPHGANPLPFLKYKIIMIGAVVFLAAVTLTVLLVYNFGRKRNQKP